MKLRFLGVYVITFYESLRVLVLSHLIWNPIFTFQDAYAFCVRTWTTDQLTWKPDLANRRYPFLKILINSDSPSNLTYILCYVFCSISYQFQQRQSLLNVHDNRSVLDLDEIGKRSSRIHNTKYMLNLKANPNLSIFSRMDIVCLLDLVFTLVDQLFKS